ncbi:sensor domain-containing diguanylate cyclase [Litchfieldella xinjiangensis]|uniref:sensor domain-containing diguanylate cyclase n=1 Tax=Litchfieldella xinjiangensis TaxID=1166948 RepID=UPI0009DF4177|nr:sensor domain-containing diguanylate cyclase [Halomonas xinjiangensis]
MSSNVIVPDETKESFGQLRRMTQRIPGTIFQLYRSPCGGMRFPYLAGEFSLMRGAERRRLRLDARHVLDRIDTEDFPRVMTAIERSAKSGHTLSIQFRLLDADGETRWMAARAQPEAMKKGTLWHGLMLDISEQVAYQAHLQALSDTDELTGLANRRKFMTRLDEEIARSNRHATPLSLVLLDLDHFKRINDTWGHLQGDQVLAELAALSLDSLREDDVIARLGGEEFALLLPLTPLVCCEPLAERLRRLIAEHDFRLPQGRVTVSVGIAEHRVGESRETLIERADQSLYAAKRNGRNRVESVT